MTEPIAPIDDDEYTRFTNAVTEAYVRHAAARGLPHPTLDDRYRTAATAWQLMGRVPPLQAEIWPEPEAKPIRAAVDMAEYRQRRADSVEAAVTPTPAEDEAGESTGAPVPEPATPGVLALMGQFFRDGWKLKRP